jgi:hypothetical protein
MKTRSARTQRSLALFGAVVILTGLHSSSALATLTDTGFETGFGAWQIFGDVLLDDTSVNQQFGTAATEGDVHLVMSTLPNNVADAGAPLGQAGPLSGNDAFLLAALSTSLGVSQAEINALSISGFNAVQGSGIYQEFTTGSANAQLSFDWNMLTNETTPTATYTDFMFWGITASGGGPLLDAGVLMDTSQNLEFGPVPVVVPASPLNSETGYRTFNTTVATAGSYRLVLGVLDIRDDNYTSGAMFDNFFLIPEPSTGLLILLGLLGLAAAGRRPRRDVPLMHRED